jgi:hypothetical protein
MVMAYERFMEACATIGWRIPMDPEFTEHVLNAVAKVMPDGSARFDRPSSRAPRPGSAGA